MQRSELIDAVAAKSRLDRHDAASAVDVEARFHELVDKELAGCLTPSEERELADLERQLDQMDEPLIREIERRDREDQRRHEDEMAEIRKIGRALDALLAHLKARSAA